MKPSTRTGRLPAFASVIALLVSLSAAGTALGANAEEYLHDARKRFAAGDSTAAVIQLKNAVQLDPNLAEARALLGELQLELGNLDEAEKELELAASLGAPAERYLLARLKVLHLLYRNAELLEVAIPTELTGEQRSEAHFYRGLAQIGKGRFEDAELEFARARDAAPRSGKPIAGQALVRFKTDRRDEARELITEGLKLAPESSELWQTRASIDHAEGRLDKAIEHYRRALQYDVDNDSARRSLAITLLDANQFRLAEAELRQLLEDQPFDAQLNYLHAVALRHTGDRKAARDAIHRASDAVEGIPAQELLDHPPSLFLAGLISYSNGQFNAATDYLAAYLDLDDTHLQARRLLAASLIRSDKPLEAIAALRTLTSRGLADASVYALMGEAYTAAGLYADAIKMLDLATREGGGNDANILRSFGRSQIALGNRAEGIAALEESIALDPEQTHTQLYLGAMYLAGREPDKALAVANRLLREKPDQPVAMNLRASAYAQRGDVERAREYYQLLLERHPGFRPAELNLAKLDARAGDFSSARERVARLLLDQNQNTYLMLELAKIEVAAGADKVAIEWLERARSIAPDDVQVGIALTKLYLRLDENERAVGHALQLKGYHPQNLSVLENLAMTQLAAGDRVSAVNTLRSMSVLAANAPGMLRRISMLARQAGDGQTALRALTQIVASDPTDADARIALIQLALERGNLGEAKTQAMMIVDQHPDAPAGPLLLGEIALREGNAEGALDYFSNVPGGDASAAVAVNRYRAQMALGQHESALADLTQWSREHPDQMLAVRALAEAYHAKGDLKTAQVHYERLVEHPAAVDPRVLNNLANLYLEIGDERAFKTAQQALQQAPGNPQIQDTLASIHLSLGQPDKALPLLREALARQADSGIIRYHLALALDALGRRQEAIRELREALKRPDLPNAEEARSKLEVLEST